MNELVTCGGCGKGVAINPTKHQYSVKYCPWCRTIVVSTHKIYSDNPFWEAQKQLQEAARQLLRRGRGYMSELIPGMSPAHLMEYAKAAFITSLATAAVYAKLKKRPTHEDIEKGRTRR